MIATLLPKAARPDFAAPQACGSGETRMGSLGLGPSYG
jgi:hypothetical protein